MWGRIGRLRAVWACAVLSWTQGFGQSPAGEPRAARRFHARQCALSYLVWEGRIGTADSGDVEGLFVEELTVYSSGF